MLTDFISQMICFYFMHEGWAREMFMRMVKESPSGSIRRYAFNSKEKMIEYMNGTIVSFEHFEFLDSPLKKYKGKMYDKIFIEDDLCKNERVMVLIRKRLIDKPMNMFKVDDGGRLTPTT